MDTEADADSGDGKEGRPDVGWSSPGLSPRFTAPAEPINVGLTGLAKAVHASGGGYFLLPSRSALQQLFAEVAR
ncbi:MAG: hypothetical protein ACOZQL_27980 [Myxococcota bacterium]